MWIRNGATNFEFTCGSHFIWPIKDGILYNIFLILSSACYWSDRKYSNCGCSSTGTTFYRSISEHIQLWIQVCIIDISLYTIYHGNDFFLDGKNIGCISLPSLLVLQIQLCILLMQLRFGTVVNLFTMVKQALKTYSGK